MTGCLPFHFVTFYFQRYNLSVCITRIEIYVNDNCLPYHLHTPSTNYKHRNSSTEYLERINSTPESGIKLIR